MVGYVKIRMFECFEEPYQLVYTNLQKYKTLLKSHHVRDKAWLWENAVFLVDFQHPINDDYFRVA